MALIITSGKEKIEIPGTDLKLPQIYGRIEFFGLSDGKTLQIAVATFVNKESFVNGSQIPTNLPKSNIIATLEEAEIQSIETAHKYAKIAFEQAGFNATIEL